MPTRGETATRPRARPSPQRERRVTLEQVAAREPRVDRQRAAEPTGPAAGERREPAAGERLRGAHEHAARDVRAVHREVEAVVHPVHEVDVQRAGRTEEGSRAQRAAPVHVGGGVARAQVRLRLDDAGGGSGRPHVGRARTRSVRARPLPRGARGGPAAAPSRPAAASRAGRARGRHAASISAAVPAGSGGLVVQSSVVGLAPHDPDRDRADDVPGQRDDRGRRQERYRQVGDASSAVPPLVPHPEAPPREAVLAPRPTDRESRRHRSMSGGGDSTGALRPRAQLGELQGCGTGRR